MKFVLLALAVFLSPRSYGNTICFAHRGGGWDYFDNSPSAFVAAADQNFEGVETDLHQTKDGKVILLHDDDLSQVAKGIKCPLNTPVSQLSFSIIKENCSLKNNDEIATLEFAFKLLRDHDTLIILDLKELLRHESIKTILELGISPNRLRLTAFYPDFLKLLKTSEVLSIEQIKIWNSIPRYENFRHPVFSQTDFNKNFHLFSAYAYGSFDSSDSHFGAWEVNYPIFLKIILPLHPEFIVTKNPKECMKIRDGG